MNSFHDLPVQKPTLRDRKEKLLQDINYYEARIKHFHNTVSSKTYFDEDCSSDSENDLPTSTISYPSLFQLKTQQTMVRTCLQATDELMGLNILDFSINVLVTDPVIEREPPVTEPGLWREVAVEARFDLVPFNVTFYVHKPTRIFGQLSYRGLAVSLLKEAHKMELTDSTLKKQRRPSDAMEVLRNYSIAIRSRRNTLARLADRFADNLHMEPLEEGGYLLKCANLLTISWRLESKKSALAKFQHKMNFSLEYMEESYLKIITQSHKLLADPTIGTEERTRLLATIISTSLEASGLTREQYESMESDLESIQNLSKRYSIDQDIEGPVAKKKKDGESEKETYDVHHPDRNRDEQMMAPPKSIPKKVKPKGKENTDQNRKSVKRPNAEEVNINAKKAKTGKNVANDVQHMDEQTQARDDNRNEKNNAKTGKINQNVSETVGTENTKVKTGAKQKNVAKEIANVTEKAKVGRKPKAKQDPTASKMVTDQNEKENDKKADAPEKIGKTNQKQTKTKKATNNEAESHLVAGKDQKEDKEVGKIAKTNDTQEVTKKKGTNKQPASSQNTARATTDKNVNPNDVQQKAKNKAAVKQTESQKNNKIVDGSKNDLNTKVPAVQKVPSKEKMVSKNDENTVDKSAKVVTRNVDPKNNAKKTSANAKAAGIQESSNKGNAAQNNKPSTSKTDENASGKDNTDKATKNQNTGLKSKHSETESVPKKVTESLKNVKKSEIIAKAKNANTKSNLELESNNEIVNKGVMHDENHSKKGTVNAMLKKDKIKPNNKPDIVTTKNVGDIKNNEPHSEPKRSKNTEALNNDAPKSKPIANPKNSIKNTMNAKNAIENATSEQKVLVNKKNPREKKNAEKNTNDKGDMIQTVVKNVATKNKAHIVDLLETKKVANNEKYGTKKDNGKIQNKITVKTLSHRNAAKSHSGNYLTGNTDLKFKSSNTAKNLKDGKGDSLKEKDSAMKISKIPQKRFSSRSDSPIKRNPLRISPRKSPSTFKSISDSNIKKKSIQKPVTGIPRLMNKPAPKAK